DDRERRGGGTAPAAVVVQLGALPGEPPQQPGLVVRARQDPAGPAAALGEARAQGEMPGVEGGQRLEPVGGEDGERRIRHGGTTFDVSERVRERRAGGSAGATTPLAATHRDGHGAHRTRTPRQLTDWPHLQWNGRHAANLAPRGPSRRLPGALGSSSVRPPDSYSRRRALLVNKPSLRHKWTSAALVGGLLVSAVAAAPAWAQRSRDDVEDEIQSVDEDLNTTIEEYNALAEEIADNEEMIAEVQADFEE